MNGIIININPVALQIGHFELRWYSIFVVLGIIAAVLISMREAKRKGIPVEKKAGDEVGRFRGDWTWAPRGGCPFYSCVADLVL